MSHTHHHHDIDFKTAFSVEKQPESQVKITGEIPYTELLTERSGAIKALGQNVKLDGFRPGHVPEAVLVKTLGETAILAEMAERAIAHMYPHILEDHNIDAIGYPQISITKIAPESPLGFTAIVAVLPVITLPDYKALAKTINSDKESTDVTDADVEKQITDILRQKAAYERLQSKATTSSESAGATELIPELTDAVVATLGQPGQFTTVDDFKSKIREHLAIEKKTNINSNHRAKITDAIVDASTMDLPKILTESELNQMFAQMNEDLERANLKMDDYLKHIKKTKEEMVTEWSPAAEKRAKLQLVLNEIAKKEDIKPDEAQMTVQVNQLLEQYKDADKHRVAVYVASVMQNEAVMKMLETQ
jgi:trigger factor